eukprot:767532-Hanusia_phi.AAC.1
MTLTVATEEWTLHPKPTPTPVRSPSSASSARSRTGACASIPYVSAHSESVRWDCPFPGPINYGPDSPAIWLPEDDLLDDPTLVRLSLHFLTFRVSCSKSYSLSYPDLAVAPIPALTRQQVRKVWPDYPPPKASSDMGYPVMLKFVK